MITDKLQMHQNTIDYSPTVAPSQLQINPPLRIPTPLPLLYYKEIPSD